MNLNQEVIYNILLNSDIHDIINLCGINTQFDQLCHDKHFWINKFKQDKLTLIIKDNWIDAYITAMVMKIINHLKTNNYPNLLLEIPLNDLLEIDPITFSLVKDDLFTNKITEKIKLCYIKVNDLWYITQLGRFPKIINEKLVINYLKKMIYLNQNFKYRIDGGQIKFYLNLL